MEEGGDGQGGRGGEEEGDGERGTVVGGIRRVAGWACRWPIGGGQSGEQGQVERGVWRRGTFLLRRAKSHGS